MLERPIHHVGPLLRVHLLRGRGRTLQVAEEHGHRAALALHAPRSRGVFELGEELGGDVAPQTVVLNRLRLTHSGAASRTEGGARRQGRTA